MANRYWVNNGGNWSDNTNHWSDTSGGSPGASVPASADNVYFDANSFTAEGQTVTIDVNANCLDMDWTGATNNPTLAGGLALDIYGNLIFIANMVCNETTVKKMRGVNKTIKTNGLVLRGDIQIWANTTLLDSISILNSNGTISVYAGIFSSGSFNISCKTFRTGGASAKTISLGNSLLTCSVACDFSVNTNLTFNANTSTIILTSNSATFGNGLTYHNVEFQGDNCTITGSNTFNELKVKAGNTAIMTAGTIQTVNSLAVDGTSGNLTTIQSTEAGNPFILRSTSDIAVNNCTIKDCVTTIGATYTAYNSVDGGGNSGWTFYIGLHVDANGILQPLGVKILRNAEFIRNFKDYSEQVPGKDGEILFGTDMEAGLISLPCFVETTPETWDAKEAQIMAALNPKIGVQDLTFANRTGKVYRVLYVGQLRFIEEGPGYRKFILPFKLHDPIVKASTQSSLTGSGTAVNNGNDACPVVVEVVGPVTNPSVTVAGKTMTYTGTVTASDTLIIDTEKMTCTFNGANALASYNGVFPKLAVGNNAVTAASAGTTTVKWYNRWQ